MRTKLQTFFTAFLLFTATIGLNPSFIFAQNADVTPYPLVPSANQSSSESVGNPGPGSATVQGQGGSTGSVGSTTVGPATQPTSNTTANSTSSGIDWRWLTLLIAIPVVLYVLYRWLTADTEDTYRYDTPLVGVEGGEVRKAKRTTVTRTKGRSTHRST